jgi:hypothetical protein
LYTAAESAINKAYMRIIDALEFKKRKGQYVNKQPVAVVSNKNSINGCFLIVEPAYQMDILRQARRLLEAEDIAKTLALIDSEIRINKTKASRISHARDRI